MGAIRKFCNSVYGPDFYASIPRRGLGSALVNFYLLILVASILRALLITGPAVSGTGDMLQSALATAISLYPSELQIDIEDGRVSTNVPEPFFIAADKDTAVVGYKNLLTIDTGTSYSAAQFNQYETFAWLTRDTLFYRSGKHGEVKASDLSQFSGYFRIDKAVIDGLAQVVRPYLGFIGPLIAIGAFFVFFIASSFRLVHLLVLALFIWVIALVLKKKIGYGASYKIGVYAMALPIIVELILDISRSWVHVGEFPFMFSLLTLAAALVNLLPPGRTELSEIEVTP
jgi:hypothetical protein